MDTNRSVEPPPPACLGTLRLRPAGRADWHLVDGWLRLEEIQYWWGSYAAAQAAVLAALDAPMALCSIIEVEGVSVGYAHAVEDATMSATSHGDDHSLSGGYRIDVFVGDRDYRGRGIGKAALSLICDEIFATTLAPVAFSVVAIRNEAAVRVHEKAGFRWLRVIDDPLLGPCWLMRHDRPQRD